MIVYTGNQRYSVYANNIQRKVVKDSIEDYIQDGLVFCLDGKDKGINEGYWTDFILKLKFDINTATDVEDGIICSSTSDVKTSTTTSFTFPTTGLLEVVCESATSGTLIVVMPRGNILLAFGFFGSLIIRASYTSYKKCINPIPAGTLANYSINSDLGWCNGKTMSLTSDTNNFTGVSNYIHLGRRSSGSNYTGKICAVRYYNRQLTPEEVLHNYFIDREKYFNKPYDSEIEYLKGTGGYINLGIYLDSKAYFELEFSPPTYTYRPYGGINNNNIDFSMRCVDSNLRYYYGTNTSAAYKMPQPYQTLIYKSILNGNNYTLYNSSGTILFTGSFTETNFDLLYPCYLFAYNNKGSLTGQQILIRHCVIKNKDRIFDLIPVRVGTVGYIYDKLSGKLFEGTGSFTLGPDIN